MFIDRARIQVRGGNGGSGCVSFRREKYVPRGGPDGGDGGRGGSVILRADPSVSTLNDFHYRQHFAARRGGHGEGSNRSGRDGGDLVVLVPAGTVIAAEEGGPPLADLAEAGQEFVAARGGRGGRGNARFATSTRQAPREAEPGEEAEERTLWIELRVLAEVGLVGFPNVGKSTLLARLTAARPKVADYPFTTLTPHLGVAALDAERSTVMADIPGLIEGAHAGAGLGDRFLQHLRRTRLLLHLVDSASLPDRDPLADYRTVRGEIEAYGAGLQDLPELVALSRVDLLQDEERVTPLERELERRGAELLRLSAVTGEGLDRLRQRLRAALDRLAARPDDEEEDGGSGDTAEAVIRLRERRR
jgi:GTP-binding protein